ncbi:hypothetical protein EON63_18355, partial [archaeon]
MPETVEPLCYDAIESVVKDKMYSENMVSKWTDEICSKITKDLVEMNKPFKYIGKLPLSTLLSLDSPTPQH